MYQTSQKYHLCFETNIAEVNFSCFNLPNLKMCLTDPFCIMDEKKITLCIWPCQQDFVYVIYKLYFSECRSFKCISGTELSKHILRVD